MATLLSSRIHGILFVIVGRNDLVYRCSLSSTARADQGHVHEFVVHSALDLVEEKLWSTTAMALSPHVDEFEDFQVRAWVAADGAKFLLLVEKVNEDAAKRTRVDENIKNFFEEVNEMYTKIALNPFYQVDQKIESKTFDKRVKSTATKWGLSS